MVAQRLYLAVQLGNLATQRVVLSEPRRKFGRGRREIAALLELETTAVKSRLQRGRARLKELLAAYAPGLEKRS